MTRDLATDSGDEACAATTPVVNASERMDESREGTEVEKRRDEPEKSCQDLFESCIKVKVGEVEAQLRATPTNMNKENEMDIFDFCCEQAAKCARRRKATSVDDKATPGQGQTSSADAAKSPNSTVDEHGGRMRSPRPHARGSKFVRAAHPRSTTCQEKSCVQSCSVSCSRRKPADVSNCTRNQILPSLRGTRTRIQKPEICRRLSKREREVRRCCRLRKFVPHVSDLHRSLSCREKIALRAMLVKRFGRCCQICSKPLVAGEMTLDHIIPKCRGGSNTIENLRIACAPCNNARHDNNHFTHVDLREGPIAVVDLDCDAPQKPTITLQGGTRSIEQNLRKQSSLARRATPLNVIDLCDEV